MQRLKTIEPELATATVKELLDAVSRKLGMVPNMMRTMANAPVVLDGYLQLSGSLSHSTLSAKVREQIALAVAQANGCNYCLAAHSAVGKMVGLTADQIRDSRLGTAIDSKTESLIQFALIVVQKHGQVSDDDLMQVRKAGFDDGAIAEVVASVALDIFTNYFNLVAETKIDFPEAAALMPESTILSDTYPSKEMVQQ